ERGAQKAFERAQGLVFAEASTIGAAQRNPAKIKAALDHAAMAAQEADRIIKNDWAAFATAQAAIDSARRAMAEANAYVGSEGVRIDTRDPGRADIEGAAGYLAAKNYEDAAKLAKIGEAAAFEAKASAVQENRDSGQAREAIEEAQAVMANANA